MNYFCFVLILDLLNDTFLSVGYFFKYWIVDNLCNSLPLYVAFFVCSFLKSIPVKNMFLRVCVSIYNG